jgi:hypothetical protein
MPTSAFSIDNLIDARNAFFHFCATKWFRTTVIAHLNIQPSQAALPPRLQLSVNNIICDYNFCLVHYWTTATLDFFQSP